MKSVYRWLDVVSQVTFFVAGVAVLAMLVHVSADLLAKYFFSVAVPATIEIVSSYYMAAAVLLPLSIATQERRHINVTLFTRWAGPRASALFDALATGLSAVYALLLAWQSGVLAVEMTHVRETWETGMGNIEVWPSRWFALIGFGAMFCYFVLQTINSLLVAAGRPSALPDMSEDLL